MARNVGLRVRGRRIAAVRLGAMAVSTLGVLLLLGAARADRATAAGTTPRAAATPPPGTVATSITITPTSGRPGAAIHVSGSGYVPGGTVGATVCPIRGCTSVDPGTTTCQPVGVSAAGTVECQVLLGTSLDSGDWVITVNQTSPYATGAGGVVCPSPLDSPAATVPALPATAPSAPASTSVPVPAVPTDPPVGIPSSVAVPPATLAPQPGQPVTGCVRAASAVVTIVPLAPSLPPASPPPPPPVVTAPSVPVGVVIPGPAGAISLPRPAQPAAATPAATPTPQPPAARLAPARATGIGLPVRDLAPGLICFITGLLVLLSSLAPPRVAVPAGNPGRLRTPSFQLNLPAFLRRAPAVLSGVPAFLRRVPTFLRRR